MEQSACTKPLTCIASEKPLSVYTIFKKLLAESKIEHERGSALGDVSKLNAKIAETH